MMDAVEVNDAFEDSQTHHSSGPSLADEMKSASRGGAGSSAPPARKLTSSVGKITVDDPRQEGNKLMPYTTYCITVVPALPGVSHVRRRYRDFEWLRSTLSSMFPGVFVPPLPPKQILGKDEEFVSERAAGLSRFLNRVACIPFLASTDAFQVFLARHENSLDAAKKEIETSIKNINIKDVVAHYHTLFPRAFETLLPDNAEEGMLRLKTFCQKSEQELTLMVKLAASMTDKLDGAAKDAAAIYDQSIKLDRAEKEYAQRPDPPRLDALDGLQAWANTLKDQVKMYQVRMYDTYHSELEDIQAMLEIIKARDNLKATHDKWKARGDKWRDPKTLVTPKNESQKVEDLAQEEASKYTLDVVTKVILCDQIQTVWQDKVADYYQAIVSMSKEQVQFASTVVATWESFTRLASL